MRRFDVARFGRGGISTLLVLAVLACLLLWVAPRTNAVVGIEEFPVPTELSQPLEMAPGPDGAVWFTEAQGNRIGRANPAAAAEGTSAGITEYRLPTPNVRPEQITLGPDGALWFTERSAGIGRLDPAAAVPGTSNGITEYAPPTRGGTIAITVGPDNALWFTESTGGRIGRLDPAVAAPGTDQGFTEFTTPSAATDLDGITKGPDGALWFTESLNHQLGRLDPAMAKAGTALGITEFPVAGVAINQLTAGPDGALWFTEFSPAGGIGRLDLNLAGPGTAKGLTQYSVPTAGAQPERIAVGPDNALWFAEFQTDKIGRLDPGGVHPGSAAGITEYTLPIADTHPFGITAGPDKDVWFADDVSHIGRLVGPGSSGPFVASAPTVTVSAWSSHTTQIWRTDTDAATIDGGDNPTGSLSFQVYSDDACAQAVGSPTVAAVTGNGTHTASFVPTEAGSFHWRVSYSGDAANAPVTTSCSDPAQAFTVSAAAASTPLTVTLGGTGTGTVSGAATPPFVCGVGPCTRAFPTGTSVTLTATPNRDSEFASWTSCPAPSGRRCTVALGEPITVRADFTKDPTVTVHIDGHGTVVDPAGFTCSEVDQPCARRYRPGTDLPLTATPTHGSRFTGWDGGCSGPGPCTVTPGVDPVDVTARFGSGRPHPTGVWVYPSHRRQLPAAPEAATQPVRTQAAPARPQTTNQPRQPGQPQLPQPQPPHHHGCTNDPGFHASNDPGCGGGHLGRPGAGDY
jgi:virginiamycin B lyase